MSATPDKPAGECTCQKKLDDLRMQHEAGQTGSFIVIHINGTRFEMFTHKANSLKALALVRLAEQQLMNDIAKQIAAFTDPPKPAPQQSDKPADWSDLR
jgi:hypothetical protein